MQQLLKKEEECREKPMERSCVQIVDCLVENVLQLDAHGTFDFYPNLIEDVILLRIIITYY